MKGIDVKINKFFVMGLVFGFCVGILSLSVGDVVEPIEKIQYFITNLF
jgi:hypothetical protein